MAGERGLNKKLPQCRSIVRLCGEVRFKVVFALTAVYCAGAVLLMRKMIAAYAAGSVLNAIVQVLLYGLGQKTLSVSKVNSTLVIFILSALYAWAAANVVMYVCCWHMMGSCAAESLSFQSKMTG